MNVRMMKLYAGSALTCVACRVVAEQLKRGQYLPSTYFLLLNASESGLYTINATRRFHRDPEFMPGDMFHRVGV